MKIGFDIAKTMFFDRPVVREMAGAAAKVLGMFGAYTRRTGRQQIKQAPRKPESQLTDAERDALQARMRAWAVGRLAEKPKGPLKSAPAGKPPYARKPRSPIRLILSVYDAKEMSVSIGPVAWGNRPGEATEALEYGGRSMTGRGPIRAPPHPNMTPAFRKNLPHLQRWRNSFA